MTALDVPRWALAFHRRHLVLVTALSLIPAGQRVASQLWTDGLSGPTQVGLDVLAEGMRLVLLVVVWRLALRDLPRPLRLWTRMRQQPRTLLAQAGLILAAFVVFRVVPEAVGSSLVPGQAHATYEAVLLGVKNLTVIPFTIIWLVAVVRTQAMSRSSSSKVSYGWS